MERKKSNKADLESKKGMFLQVGLVVTLALILISFEWTTMPNLDNDLDMVSEIIFEEQMLVTRRPEPPKDLPKPELPSIAETIELVDDEIVVPDVDFGNEVDENTLIDYFNNFDDGGDEIVVDDAPFVIVEDMPTFNGGIPDVEFRKYIRNNVKYPEVPAENGVSGRVYVQFIVNSKGKIVNAEVLKPVDPHLDKEALRVINSSPQWIPGKQRGKAVSVIFTFPIAFVLQ